MGEVTPMMDASVQAVHVKSSVLIDLALQSDIIKWKWKSIYITYVKSLFIQFMENSLSLKHQANLIRRNTTYKKVISA